MRTLIVLLIALFTLSPAFAAHNIIIDTDAGIDDIIATLYLLKNPDITVKAITIESDGEAHCKAAARNIGGLLTLVNRTSIPFACGSAVPIKGHHHFPEWIHQEADNLAGANTLLPAYPFIPAMTAAELLHKTLVNAPSPIDIVAIGPLTTIAQVFQSHPAVKQKIHMIYFMGGAVYTAGNVAEIAPQTHNTKAEWNIYIDPVAADIVFRSNVPITMVGLDITNQTPVSIAFFEKLKQHQDNPTSQFFYELFHRNQAEIYQHIWYFWDSLTATIASENNLAAIQSKKLRIILAPELQSGQTIEDKKHGNSIRFSTMLHNKEAFEQKLIQTIDS